MPKKLTRPHPLITRWLAEHDRRKKEARISRFAIPVPEYTPIDRRQHQILHALFKELERQGVQIHEGDGGRLHAEIAGERVEFQLREKCRQIRQPLTDEEKHWRLSYDRDWKMVLEPTGKLIFVIKSYALRGLRTTWLETDENPMESLLPEIVGIIHAAGALLAERTVQREKEERRLRIAHLIQAEEEKKQRLDEMRWQRFLELAEQWHEARRIREFLEALKTFDMITDEDEDNPNTKDWIAWAEAHLLYHDPLRNGRSALFGILANIRI